MNIRLEGGPRCGELTSLDRPGDRVTYGLHRGPGACYYVYVNAGYSDSNGVAVFRHVATRAVDLRLGLWMRLFGQPKEHTIV